jgi:hypothetical protein
LRTTHLLADDVSDNIESGALALHQKADQTSEIVALFLLKDAGRIEQMDDGIEAITDTFEFVYMMG